MKDLHQFRSIFIRELLSYFNSPIAYIYSIVFVVLMGSLFMMNFFLLGQADMRYFFSLLPIVLCVFVPAVTMRSWAEEKKGNTFELLLTFPMNSLSLVMGKFFACLIFYAFTLAGTLLIPIVLFYTGNPDIGPIIGGYAGGLLLGALFLSVGIFISGLCRDQIIAFIVSMLVCFFFYMIGIDFIAGLIDGWLPGTGTFLMTNFGMTRHFESFAKGVVDNRDILYFIVMIAAFLALNVFSIEDRLRPKAKLFFSVAVAICLGISMTLNSLVGDVFMGRFDLTEDKLYTVTETTKKILRELEAPVQVKLYISPANKMPTVFKSLEQDIRDQIAELQVFSEGTLDFKVIHMDAPLKAQDEEEPDENEQRLLNKGIMPFQVQSIDQDEMGIRRVYSAITIAYKEKSEEIIPRVIPQTLFNLEYMLMSKIYRLNLDKVPTVALMAPYFDREVDPKMREMLRQMGQTPEQFRQDSFRILESSLHFEDYDVRRIRFNKDEPLPEDLDTLIVIAPAEINDRQRYEINRFLQQGGNVLISYQRFRYNYQQQGRGVAITAHQLPNDLDLLLSHYGLTLSEQMLMDENHESVNVSGGAQAGPFRMSVPVKAPMQFRVEQETMNQDVSITGRLSPLVYFWGAALKMDEEKIPLLGLKKIVLFSSGEKSWEVPFQQGPLQRTYLQSPQVYTGRLPLAVLLEGQFPDAYSGQSPPPWPDEDAAQETVEDTAVEMIPQPGKLIVVGCSTMFEEEFIKQGGAGGFFLNAVDSLTLSDELIDIRSRQPIDRRIQKLSKGKKIWVRFLTTLLIPFVLIVFGSIRAILRRKEKELYLKLIPSKAEFAE